MKISATGALTGRSISEWIGRSADSAIPKRVKLRIYLRFNGNDAITGLPLVKGYHFDHKIALKDWIATPQYPHGNFEGNLQPVNASVNTAKAAQENSDRAKVTRLQMNRAHIEAPKAKIQSEPFYSNPKPEKGAGFSPSHKAHLEKMATKYGVSKST